MNRLVPDADIEGFTDAFARRIASRPENLPFVQLLLNNRLQQPDGIETDLGTASGSCDRTTSSLSQGRTRPS